MLTDAAFLPDKETCDWRAKVIAWMLIFWVVIAVGVAGATLLEMEAKEE